jgi:hypothetical protein
VSFFMCFSSKCRCVTGFCLNLLSNDFRSHYQDQSLNQLFKISKLIKCLPNPSLLGPELVSEDKSDPSIVPISWTPHDSRITRDREIFGILRSTVLS